MLKTGFSNMAGFFLSSRHLSVLLRPGTTSLNMNFITSSWPYRLSGL